MVVTTADWLQAQYSVLGAAMLEPAAVPQVLAETTVRDYSGPCQAVYTAMSKLFAAGKPTDVVAVADMLEGKYNEFLAELMKITPSAANVGYYIGVCQDQSRVLGLRALGASLAQAESRDQAQQLLDEANAMMAQRQRYQAVTMMDAMKRFAERAEHPKTYISWPIPELNDRIYAEPGDFIVLGGYPSAGKSALALQCAAHWAKRKRVGFYSLETGSDKLFDRMVAMLVGIPMQDIKQNRLQTDDWTRFATASTDIGNLQLELIPAAGMMPTDIKATALARRHEIVIIDYLQLLQAPGNSRYEQVTNVSLALHTLAQSMGITVMALSQLARAGKDSGSPGMASLRESGQIEQDADLIFLLYLDDPDKPQGPRIMRVAKNKEGTCPKIKLDFDGPRQRFSKAGTTSEVVATYAAVGRQAQRANKRKGTSEQGMDGQLPILPQDEPIPESWEMEDKNA